MIEPTVFTKQTVGPDTTQLSEPHFIWELDEHLTGDLSSPNNSLDVNFHCPNSHDTGCTNIVGC